MERSEEYRFRQDVYSVLIEVVRRGVSGFFFVERRVSKDDDEFFSKLVDYREVLLIKAFRQGRACAVLVRSFLDDYKKVVNDNGAYQVFLHQDELNKIYKDKVFEWFIDAGVRVRNFFDKYWSDQCNSSIKNLYYYFLITDSTFPKYKGLENAKVSLPIYNQLLDIKAQVDKDIRDQINMDVESVSSIDTMSSSEVASLQFLNYIYNEVAAVEYPDSAIVLNSLKSDLALEKAFYQELLIMDVPTARDVLKIGEVTAKKVVRLCEMMRAIVLHPQSRALFENRKKVELSSPLIEMLIENNDIRTTHAYQRLKEICGNSVLNMYLKVIGSSLREIKLPELNAKKSQALFCSIMDTIPELNKFISTQLKNVSDVQGDSSHSVVASSDKEDNLVLLYGAAIHTFGFSNEEINEVISTNNRIGHFPLFLVISHLFSKMRGDRAREISKRTLNIIYGNSIEDINEVASSVGLTRERVRQIREVCIKEILGYPTKVKKTGLMGGFFYKTQSEYDFNIIRKEENVNFSDEYITACVALTNDTLSLIGNPKTALLKPGRAQYRLYVVPKRLDNVFNFNEFVTRVDEMAREKRFCPYYNELEGFVKSMIKEELTDETFYAIIKECRKILLKGYPTNLVNNQIVFPANAQRTLPNRIEDILNEFKRPMTAKEICEQLNLRDPDLNIVPSKIGPNAIRNKNIVPVSRSSTYALIDWNYTDKRGGTLRDLAAEFLNSLDQPIATVNDICDYIAKFRKNVKEDSIKANLLAETSNRFSLYYKEGKSYIGFSDDSFGEEYVLKEKNHGHRSFKDNIERLEEFINANGRFPYTSYADKEESRLSRFYSYAMSNQRKGILSDEDSSEIERIEATYGKLKVKKARVSWEERLERFVKHINENDRLPFHSSKEYAWYEENKALYIEGKLDPTKTQSFAVLMKIVDRMDTASKTGGWLW